MGMYDPMLLKATLEWYLDHPRRLLVQTNVQDPPIRGHVQEIAYDNVSNCLRFQLRLSHTNTLWIRDSQVEFLLPEDDPDNINAGPRWSKTGGPEVPDENYEVNPPSPTGVERLKPWPGATPGFPARTTDPPNQTIFVGIDPGVARNDAALYGVVFCKANGDGTFTRIDPASVMSSPGWDLNVNSPTKREFPDVSEAIKRGDIAHPNSPWVDTWPDNVPRPDTPNCKHTYEPVPKSVFCNHWIEHPTDPHGGTYCKLFAGHDGDHSPHYLRTMGAAGPDLESGRERGTQERSSEVDAKLAESRRLGREADEAADNTVDALRRAADDEETP